MAEKTFDVTGMTCDNCVQHVTKALQQLPGVTAVRVDLASKSAKVEGEFEDAQVIEAIVEEGYEAAAR